MHSEFVSAASLRHSSAVEIRNPADKDEVVGTIPGLTADDIDAVVAAAHQARRAWARRDPAERLELMTKALAEVNIEGTDVLLTRENGRVLADSTRELTYLSYPVSFLTPHVDWLTDGEDLGDNGRQRTQVLRRPYGVIGIITPWNVPIGMSVITLTPALLAGNCVVALLPASCPLAVLQIFGQLARAFPDGVLSLLASPNPEVAQALVEHPLVRSVHFTGSAAVGALVAHEAADTITPVTLELGGNDPGILLDDIVDDDTIYPRIVAAAFAFGGQACVALKRLYVPRSRLGDVLAGIGKVLGPTVVGNGLDSRTTMGPLHTARGRERVLRLVAEARSVGGQVHEFGTMTGDSDKGHFVLPTLVSGLDNRASLVQEEQFGPTLPLIAYDSLDQAIEMANDSDFGLGASVWSADAERAEQVAREMEAGMTWINMHAGAGIDGRVPWGGLKHSGVGRGGANRAGLEFFTEPCAIIAPSILV